MFFNYRQCRKEYVKLCQLRKTGDSIHNLAKVVMDITDDPNVKAQLIDLRAREEALLVSIDADIPWICKVLPVK